MTPDDLVAKVSVLQFSNDVRVELLPSVVDPETFHCVMADLVIPCNCWRMAT